MTVGTTSLSCAVNAKIPEVETPLEYLQLASIVEDFDEGFAKIVANCAALPPAADNKGRWIFLQDFCTYRWSDGTTWSDDFTSTPSSQMYASGCNGEGRLGDNSITTRSSPVSVVGGFTDWCQVSGALRHSLGVRTNGTAWAWGCNASGQLGDDTIVSKRSPVSVVGGFTDWCQVSGGGYHSLGVRTNGTAWAWGCNSRGQLGDNTEINKSSPVSVVGGFTDWCQVSAGDSHSLGVRTNGTAWAWGANNTGLLGDNTTGGKCSPVSVVGGFTDWCQVSAGGTHSLGVRSNGTAWAWGSNTSGKLGDNTTTTRSSPVSVVGGFTDWCQVSGGSNHSLGVRTNGTAWAWGISLSGRLGDNTLSARSSPVSVVGGFTDWCQVSAGGAHSIGLRTNGTAWAWGCNSRGQLGDNTLVSSCSPVSVVGSFTGWSRVSAGSSHSLSIVVVDKGFL